MSRLILTEKQVQRILYDDQKNHSKAMIPNVYWNDDWEADMIRITPGLTVVEYEIKVSKFDYLNDMNKVGKHSELKRRQDFSKIPNKFYYVCPEGLVALDEVPEYAGLVYIVKRKDGYKVAKKVIQAPTLHNETVDTRKWQSVALKIANRLIEEVL